MKKGLKLLMFFIGIVLIQGCSDDSDNESETNDPDKEQDINFKSSDYHYYISGKINGKAFIYGQKLDDTALNYQEVFSIPLEGATCAYSEDGLDYKVSYSTSIYPNFDNEDTQPALGIDFRRFYRCSDDKSSSEIFNDLFPIGNYEFSKDDEASGVMSQIGITYSPIANEDKYYVSYGVQPTSSVFKITNSEGFNTYYNQTQIIEGEFSAKLYNAKDTSDVIDITEGRFKISITK